MYMFLLNLWIMTPSTCTNSKLCTKWSLHRAAI